MRDPNRIPGVLKEVQNLWEKYPDVRLGQLLLIVMENREDLFYCEDEKLLQRLKAFEINTNAHK